MIFISFSLKPLTGSGRTFEDAILPVLTKIADSHGGEELHHGFMPKAVLLEKGIPTDIPDALDRLFGEYVPVVCHFDPATNKPDREGMVALAKDEKALIYVIGPIVEGVLDEIVAYSLVGTEIICYPWAEL